MDNGSSSSFETLKQFPTTTRHFLFHSYVAKTSYVDVNGLRRPCPKAQGCSFPRRLIQHRGLQTAHLVPVKERKALNEHQARTVPLVCTTTMMFSSQCWLILHCAIWTVAHQPS